MKLLSCLIILGISSFCFLGSTTSIFAVENYHTGELLLFDNFEDGNYNGWTVESGTWLVHDNGLGYGKNILGTKCRTFKYGRISRGGIWDNYSVEVDIKNLSGIDEMIGFRRTDNNNFYEVNLRHYHYYDNPTPQINLNKTQNGLKTTLKSKNLPLEYYRWYHLKIEVFQEHIQIWLDSNLIIEFDDIGTTVRTGNISLDYWTGVSVCSIVRFDNIRVTSLSKFLNPVIFIPGIGGSEFQASQDIIWSKDDGHGGIYQHAYKGGEKVWVNETEAAMVGDDDYFDILKLKSDGQTSEAPLSLNGNLTPFGYADIDPFFQEIGYTKGVNFFVYPYDWRKDVRLTKDSLDGLIEEAKQKSGMPKVNIVAHSMGGLVARNYIADPTNAAKVGKLIELGVPHLGSVDALKAIMYGKPLSYEISFIPFLSLTVIPESEIKDIFSNLTAGYQLLPSEKYSLFYSEIPPFVDDRDIDKNQITGYLNFPQIKELLKNLTYNMEIFRFAEQFHSTIDTSLSQDNGVKIYGIVGSHQPTLGQIRESYWITWPFQLIPKRDEIFIDGDGTVPLYSASLKSKTSNISGNAQIYYVDQKHPDLVRKSGPSMITVKTILQEGDTLPVEVKSEKFTLEGTQISLDQDGEVDLYDDSGNHTGKTTNGKIETNIPGTFYDTLGDSKHVFIKKSAPKVKVKLSNKQKVSQSHLTLRSYSNDTVNKTSIYPQLSLPSSTSIEFTIDPISPTSPAIPIGGQLISPTYEATGSSALDFSPPAVTVNLQGEQNASDNYLVSTTVTISVDDTGSGVSEVIYSLDNWQTTQVYTQPFTVSTLGTYTLQVTATDNLGNTSLPVSQTFAVISPTPTPTATPTPTPITASISSSSSEGTSGNNSSGSSSTTISSVVNTLTSLSSSLTLDRPAVLGSVLGISKDPTKEESLPVAAEESSKYSQTMKGSQSTQSDSSSHVLKILIIPALIVGALPIIAVVIQTLFLGPRLRKPPPK